ncbi:retrovirus-related Pol polyprotein from transposon opus [Trichonephila inaurata madagascariensis]|uniref:Retrovirus-related Pol polyprotein from transposon opus n=1 Tax=Trichonephila inaurata madagascariensis TaxID=2747483 RepID=A0A8X6XSA2_9ARAC|nr:retrovirus-related Pol polyprotein from transposon opus [Trichonephila inaurata madagascariensis]
MDRNIVAHIRDFNLYQQVKNLTRQLKPVASALAHPESDSATVVDTCHGDPAHFGILKVNSLSPSNRNAVLRISINGVSGTAFADSGASHSIAGATLYTILLQQGAAFEKTSISLSFADGLVTQKEVLRTFQTVLLEGRKFKTPFIILPDAKNNSTLLGVDFLENAGIVLNFRKNCWTFCDDSRKSYNFVTPYQSTSVNVLPVAINNCQLREDEGQELLGSQHERDAIQKKTFTKWLNKHLKKYPCSSFFTISIAAKCRDIDCGPTESSDPSCLTVDVDRASTFSRKSSTLHRGRPAPDLWSISVSPLQNLTNNLRTVRSLVSTTDAFLTLATVAAAECPSQKSCCITIHTSRCSITSLNVSSALTGTYIVCGLFNFALYRGGW